MNVLIIDTDACGLDFAYRCAQAGHAVRWFLRPPKNGDVMKDGHGFKGVERVDDWRSHMQWAKKGLIWTVHNALYIKELDEWRRFGFPIFAPSFRSAQLEINRGEGMRALEQHEIPVPRYQVFQTLEEAEQYAKKQADPLVFKPMGDEEDKSLTSVSSSAADMAQTIKRWREQGMKLKGPCMLQEKIEGFEIGVSGWFGPAGFLPKKWNMNFEHKGLMPGGYGPNTGEMGTVIQYVGEAKLADQVLAPLEKFLSGLGHVGDVDLNCIVEKKTGVPYVLEFTCRPGWPHFQIVQATHKGDPAAWMKDLLEGHDTLKVSYDVAVGVVIAQPQYPYGTKDLSTVTGIPIYGTEEVWEQIHPWQMMLARGYDMDGKRVVEREIPQTTGDYVMVVSGTGKTVRAACERCYGAVESIKLKNMIVRNDVGQKLERDLPQLHDLGHATDMNY